MIQGFCKEWGYIATQAPMPETVVDFWKMIWKEEVLIVCMLMKITEGGQKICKQYWPEIGNTVEHGQVTILNVKQRVYADYTHRIFQVTKFTTFTGWPKQEVPMYWHSVVEYFNELRGHSSGPGPILVHCATGTGRTGTFILCDIGLHSTAAEGVRHCPPVVPLQHYILEVLLEVEHSLVSLKRYPPDATDSDYISAVSIDGVKVKGQ
ncbi:tyrosine-protein phosphatase non-receptor type 7-like [Neodiprion pinetum]|uniref:tyrosine-protein phosphatase non-receptor type 7-like n=1 Tax=Neodiprion pinetum TaxID=441929 RepID=UPI001EDF0BF5|nr:tyrosine-protein phosphatase non-receptor type 7-like [Neodiprion pinetum]